MESLASKGGRRMNGRTNEEYAEIAAKRILKELQESSNYVDLSNEVAILDGHFDIEDLEAITWWMKNCKEKGEE